MGYRVGRIQALVWTGIAALSYASMPTRVSALAPLLGDDQTSGCQQERESKRERDQRLADVFKALDLRPGAVVADIGAGHGFYTVRLARAVGDEGRVYAVDVSASSLRDLRSRIGREGLRNVQVIEGDEDDPHLPAGTLDAALIVNAYHEMFEHQAMLERIRAALKPAGRLVILEPVSAARRTASRADQVRQHEIAPEFVMQDARQAGFRVTHLEDPFSRRSEGALEWLVVLTPAAGDTATDTTIAEPASEANEVSSPDLRVSLEELARLQDAASVVILDVRDESMFRKGHIPGARLTPLSDLRTVVDELKSSDSPVVTYCSCPEEESSARAALYLRKRGVQNVRALVGGYEKWKASRNPR